MFFNLFENMFPPLSPWFCRDFAKMLVLEPGFRYLVVQGDSKIGFACQVETAGTRNLPRMWRMYKVRNVYHKISQDLALAYRISGMYKFHAHELGCFARLEGNGRFLFIGKEAFCTVSCCCCWLFIITLERVAKLEPGTLGPWLVYWVPKVSPTLRL